MFELSIWEVALQQALKVSPSFVCPLDALLNWLLVFPGSFEADECDWPAVRENLEMFPPKHSVPSVTRMFGVPIIREIKGMQKH